jgi:2-polyprenyl-3-methyl-5-hydroxy-6-metoxy-1,4-benzoquinol methylase
VLTDQQELRVDNPSRQRFNALAAEWDQNPGRIVLTQAVAEAILRQVSVREDTDMLDYGCGTGLASVQVTTAYVIKRPLEDGTTR